MFKKKNAQKFVVVHRGHDDPDYYNDDENSHVFVPVTNPNERRKLEKEKDITLPTQAVKSSLVKDVSKKGIMADNDAKTNKSTSTSNKNTGKAALYGIEFDDSNYDYTQHLKPMGQNPNAFFLAAKNGANNKSYMRHQQDIADEIKGFKPDLNPDLREVLEALEDDAYVVNEDIVVSTKKEKKSKEEKNNKEMEIIDDEDDDIFAELLQSGEVGDDNLDMGRVRGNDYMEDEWDFEDEMNNYEDEHYHEENENIVEQINNFEDLHQIDYQSDVKRFQEQNKKNGGLFNNDELDGISENDFDSDVVGLSEDEEGDTLGDLPLTNNLNSHTKSKNAAKNKRKQRKKKGAMSDISGFSMSSSAIARTETMTVLDDKYDQIIESYDNYQQEQEEAEEQSYKPFNMEDERDDFESLLDDFLDNYELESGGRKLVKKDAELQRLKDAVDEVSKGKLSMRRNREKQKLKEMEKAKKNSGVNNITNSLNSLRF